MAQIGNLGSKIIFETSDKKVLTFNNFKQTVAGKWESYDLVGKKPKKQFLGPESRSLTFDITLNAMYGVKPRATLKTIEEMVESGTAEKLVINGATIGNNKWVIKSVSETWDVMLSKGELLKATISLSLEEYT